MCNNYCLRSCMHVCLQGLAFQLIDDVLDFTGTSTSLGKGSLSDIRHVRLSLFHFKPTVCLHFDCLNSTITYSRFSNSFRGLLLLQFCLL